MTTLKSKADCLRWLMYYSIRLLIADSLENSTVRIGDKMDKFTEEFKNACGAGK